MTPEILHYVGYDDDRGGLVAVIRALAAAGRFPCVLGLNQAGVQRRQPPLPAVEFPPLAGEKIDPANFWRARAVATQVQAWLRVDRRRVFHAHSRAGLLVALWLHARGERRVVVSVHCFGRQRWFYRWAQRCFGDRWFWYSPAMKRHYGCADDRSWSGCMPNGLAAPLPAAIRPAPQRQGLRLGGAGATVSWKRWDLVLDALARLPPECPVEFRHIGGPLDLASSRACEQALHARARELGLAARVRWLGWQPSSAELLRDVDVVVVPSDGEPFSMIALEALFAGVPVIATRGGGPEDFILEGRNGWLVAPGDAGALAEGFLRCLQPETWHALRLEQAHLRQFSMTETLAPRWEEIYARLPA